MTNPINSAGTFTLWTLQDARNIINASTKGHDGVVIGGSFVGMQALDSLKRKGLRLRVVELTDRIMPNILDREGSRMLEDYLRDKGIRLFLRNRLVAINESGNSGKKLILADGTEINTNFCILSVGARPNLFLADETSLKKKTGLLVDSCMRTNNPNIFAAGDVAEVFDMLEGRRKVFGLWSTAIEQGRIAGLNMVGRKFEYFGGMDMNAIHILGYPVLTLGKTNLNGDGEHISTRVFLDRSKKIYRKFIMKEDVVIGAILMGQVNDAGRIGNLIRSKYKIRPSDVKFSLGGLRDRVSYMTYGNRVKNYPF